MSERSLGRSVGRRISGTAAAVALVIGAAPAGASAAPAATLMTVDPELPDHTIYRPADLGPARTPKLPVVVFSEGGCRNIGNRSVEAMSYVASHGYVVVVAGPPSPFTKGARDNNWKPAPGANVLAQPRDLVAAIDWAVRENGRRGSAYYDRLDTAKVAAAGVSCGGVQALDLTVRDPRVAATVMIYSGLFPDDKPAGSVQFSGVDIVRADLPKITKPILYLYGGPDDIAHPNAENDIAHIGSAPLFAASLKSAKHGDGLAEANGGPMWAAAVAWLEWWFKKDADAGRQFTAPDCPLCTDPGWTVKRNNLP